MTSQTFVNTEENQLTVKGLLCDHVVHLKFEKRDGEIRILKGTLVDSFITWKAAEGSQKKAPNHDKQAVWDIDLNEFRAFRWDSLLEYAVD